MSKWFYSLQFRLILGFAIVLALALSGVGLYVGYAAQQEIERFGQETEDARVARMERLVRQVYARRQDWTEVGPLIQQASSLYGRRIVLSDEQGNTVLDSHSAMGPLMRDFGPRSFSYHASAPIRSDGREIGSLAITPGSFPGGVPEPPFSRLVSEVKESLLWTGLAAALGGLLLVSLVSRRFLAPVGALSVTARRLGEGDLSQRAPVTTRDEVGELGRAFNSMAEALEQADRQRRSLMADVAHELRTPLSNIQGYLEAIKDGLLQPDSATIDALYGQVLHLARLVEDVRLLTLVETGGLRLDLQPDSLPDLLHRAVNAVQPRADAQGVSLALDCPADLPLVEMDRTRISQVVGNLLENALLHTPQGGAIAVSAEVTEDGMARVSVLDTGPGIPPGELARLFDRFYRADPSRSRATGGAGLGLTIARQLVQAHGGSIQVESAMGSGSVFLFELPMNKNREERED